MVNATGTHYKRRHTVTSSDASIFCASSESGVSGVFGITGCFGVGALAVWATTRSGADGSPHFLARGSEHAMIRTDQAQAVDGLAYLLPR
jgi:hypothetical protein